MKLQGATISLGGINFAVVLVTKDLIQRQGEADMAIQTMQPSFGGVPVVLMAQKDDGTPVYYGDRDLVQSLVDVPVEKMPWKTYSVN